MHIISGWFRIHWLRMNIITLGFSSIPSWGLASPLPPWLKHVWTQRGSMGSQRCKCFQSVMQHSCNPWGSRINFLLMFYWLEIDPAASGISPKNIKVDSSYNFGGPPQKKNIAQETRRAMARLVFVTLLWPAPLMSRKRKHVSGSGLAIQAQLHSPLLGWPWPRHLRWSQTLALPAWAKMWTPKMLG